MSYINICRSKKEENMKIKVKNKKDEFYTAKNDLVFKAIFCDVNNTFLLKTLIEKCLDTKIEILKLYPPEVIKKIYMRKERH